MKLKEDEQYIRQLRAQSPFYRFIDHPLARGRIAQFNEEQKAELERRLAVSK